MSSAPASKAISIKPSSSIALASIINWPFRSNWKATAPTPAKLPPFLLIVLRTSEAERFLLSVVTSTTKPTPPAP